MPDHPQCTVLKPSRVFRETFLEQVEVEEPHAVLRQFGELLDDLVTEARIVTVQRDDREPPQSWVQRWARATLLDLAAVRDSLQAVHESMGEGDKEDTRLALRLSDLIADVDKLGGEMLAAYRVAMPALTPPEWPTFGGSDGA